MSSGRLSVSLRSLVGLLASLLLFACSGALPAPPPKVPRDPDKIWSDPVERHDAQLSENEALLAKLSPDERAEQLADWALAIALAREAPHDAGALQALSQHPLLRSPDLEVLGALDYGRGRYAVTGSERWLVVVPADDPQPERTLATLADRARAQVGRIARDVEVVRYRTRQGGSLQVERQGTLPGSALFSSRYGYIENLVRSLDDLKALLKQLGNLTYFRQQGDHMLVGGRRASDSKLQVTLDDVAALYQGHMVSLPGLREVRGYDRELNGIEHWFGEMVDAHNANIDLIKRGQAPSCARFERALSALGRRFGEPQSTSLVDCAASLPQQIVLAHADLLGRLRPLVEHAGRQYGSHIQHELQGVAPVPGPGFSLDPQWDTARLTENLQLLARDPDQLIARARSAAQGSARSSRGSQLLATAAASVLEAMQALSLSKVGHLDASVISAIDSIVAKVRSGQGRSIEALPQLARLRLEMDQSKVPQGIVLGRLLHFIEAQDRIQCARYEGELSGTRVGMNLFYTDLLAKLWAGLDYQGTAPTKRLPGFVTMQGLPVGTDSSSTRIWFGARSDRITRSDDLSMLHFSPVVSRVYSAASSALNPGQESVPQDGVRHVLDWWTNHFAAVAEIEPQYRLQDELQKWSFLTHALAFKDVMPELDRVAVRRDHRFHDYLTSLRPSNVPPGVDMLPTTRWIGGQPTWECLDLLASQDRTGVRTIYGGVSLADLTQARVLPVTTAGAGPPPPPPEAGRIHLEGYEEEEAAAWSYRELPESRFAPKSSQEKRLFTQTEVGHDRVTTSWRGESGKGGRAELRYSNDDVVLSTQSFDKATAQERVVALAAKQHIQAKIANAKVLSGKPRGPPAQIQRTPHRPSDEEPPSSLGVEMRQDWRNALGMPTSKETQPTPTPKAKQPSPSPKPSPSDDRRP